jgi:hypothetical protein
MEHMKIEMAREIKAMGIKLCSRWVCLLWVTSGKLVGGGGATALWWVGSLPTTPWVAGVVAHHPTWPTERETAFDGDSGGSYGGDWPVFKFEMNNRVFCSHFDFLQFS